MYMPTTSCSCDPSLWTHCSQGQTQQTQP